MTTDRKINRKKCTICRYVLYSLDGCVSNLVPSENCLVTDQVLTADKMSRYISNNSMSDH